MAIRLGLRAQFIFGPVGFARVARMIALGLEDLGVDVRLYGVRNPRYDRTITKEEYERIKGLTQKTWEPDIWLGLGPGCGFVKDVEKGWNIGMSMWETPRLPGFGRHCSEVDEVWVPSPFNWQVFSESEWTSEEHVSYMPLGVDTELNSPRPSKVKITDDFRTQFDFIYGIICGYSARKGVDLVLTAHQELFSRSDSVALLIKGDHFGSKLFPKDMKTLYEGTILVDLSDRPADVVQAIERKVQKNKPVVLYSFDPLSDIQIAEVYLAMDGFVFPSRGEGFGLPPLEAMSCGIPVVGTAATGMKEFMLEDISYPVQSRGWKQEPGCDWITQDYVGHVFADPDYEQYRDSVWRMYSNREEAQAKAKKAREFVVNNYRAELMAARMKERLEEIMGGGKTTENFWPKPEEV